MNKEVSNIITQIARIRNVDINYVCETLKNSIVAGLKKRFGPDAQIEAEMTPESGELKVFIAKQVKDEVKNPITEISLEEAKAINPNVEVGSTIRIEIPLSEIGRSAIRKASDELIVKLREAERNKLFDEFNRKRGEIISGTISKIGKDEIIVNIGLTEAILLNKDQLKTDHYRQGAPIKTIIYRVDKTPIGPRIYLSRTHNDFLRKLLLKEVPEIREGIVEIKAIARAPGQRAKVAVASNDEKVDPVGACVGYRKSRIENIIRELSGEKIDIVLFSKDMDVYISRALAPAKVKEVIREGETYFVVVPDDDFSIAIGKRGQNVGLASALVGTKLEVLKESEYRNRVIAEKAKSISIKQLDLPEDVITKLQDAQIFTAFDVLNLPTDQIAMAANFEPEKVEQVKKQVREQLEKMFNLLETKINK
ncbi:MAG: transcription termination factor NusA [candidate division WOR-3 bacterium]